MLIHRDNPEERGQAASQLVIGDVDEAQSGQQMALIAWKVWGVGGGQDKPHYHLSLHHIAHKPHFHPHPYLLCLV